MTTNTDNWKTPKWLYKLIMSTQSYKDICPPEHTIDALTTEWTEPTYVNPPYSNPLPFVLKGIEQHKKHGITVIFLLKHDHTTKWWRELATANAHFFYIEERLHYSDADSAPFPSVLAILIKEDTINKE